MKNKDSLLVLECSPLDSVVEEDIGVVVDTEIVEGDTGVAWVAEDTAVAEADMAIVVVVEDTAVAEVDMA